MTDLGIDLWAIDEVHFQEHGSRWGMSIALEKADPVLMHELTQRNVGNFTAVRLRDGKFFTIRKKVNSTEKHSGISSKN